MNVKVFVVYGAVTAPIISLVFGVVSDALSTPGIRPASGSVQRFT